MTLKGHVVERYGTPVQVTSYEAWQTVAVLFGPSELQAGGRFLLWASGAMGHVEWPGGAAVQRCAIQVALGARDASTGQLVAISTRELVQIGLADARLGLTVNPRAGIPWQFATTVDTRADLVHPQFGATWPAGRELVIAARLVANGGQPVGSFHVFDWHALAFDLAAIGAGGYAVDRFDPAQPQAFGPPAVGYRNHFLGTDPLPAAGLNYLTFWSARWQGYATGDAAPRIEPYTAPDGTPGSRATFDRAGLVSRPPVGAVSLNSVGGFRVVGAATPTQFLGLQTRDGYDAGGAVPFQSQLVSFCAFAIRTTEFYRFRFDQQELHDPGDPLIGTGNVPDQAARVPFEAAAEAPARNVLLRQARVLSSTIPPLVRHYRPLALAWSAGPIYVAPWADLQIAGGPAEQVPFAIGTGLDRFSGGRSISPRFEFPLWAGLSREPLLQDSQRPIEYHVAMLFGLDDDPSNYELPPVLAGSVVALVPSRESLDPSGLDPLPIEPDATYREELIDAVEDFLSDVGYRWRMPRFTLPRRTFALNWPGLLEPDREALYDFLISRTAVQWTPKGEATPRAFAIIGRPTITPEDFSTWSISADLVELVYVGG